MKCIQLLGQGIPIRVTNDDADFLVRTDHDAEFCPKSVFKEYRKAHPEHPARSRIDVRRHAVRASQRP